MRKKTHHPPAAKSAPEDDAVERSPPLFVGAWEAVRSDPAKAAAVAYFWLTVVGYARMFGVGIAFGVNPLDYASPSDFLLAGLRDPFMALMAAVSGGGLYWMWGKGLRGGPWRLAVGPGAVALVLLAGAGSAFYRYQMVAGAWQASSSAPLPMTVRLDDKDGGTPGELTGVRLVLSTSDFFIFYLASSKSPPDAAVVVVPKREVKRMSMSLPATK